MRSAKAKIKCPHLFAVKGQDLLSERPLGNVQTFRAQNPTLATITIQVSPEC